jgi:hypothetical protein
MESWNDVAGGDVERHSRVQLPGIGAQIDGTRALHRQDSATGRRVCAAGMLFGARSESREVIPMTRALQVNDRVRVSTRHWKCAGQAGMVVAFDPGKVNKYLVRFEHEIPGILQDRELWLGDQDLRSEE